MGWHYSTRVMRIGIFRKQMGHCEVKSSPGPKDLAQAESLAVTTPQSPEYLNPLHRYTALSVQQEPVMAEIVHQPPCFFPPPQSSLGAEIVPSSPIFPRCRFIFLG